MAFDWEKFGQAAIRSRTDIGTFLMFSGIGGLADAIWNFAPYAEFYTLAPFTGALVLGVKKLLIDRDDPKPGSSAAEIDDKRKLDP